MSDKIGRSTDRPNPVVRGVASMAVSVRTKLLVAFLGITCLLVGLTLFGLYALHHANVRTEAMIRDQERIAYFNDIYATISNLNAHTLSVFIPDRVRKDPRYRGIYDTPQSSIYNLAGALARDIAVGVRRFGQAGMPDEQAITGLRAQVKIVMPATLEVRRLGNEGKTQAAAEHGLANILPPLQAMQRDAYTIVQQIEDEMRERARTTTQAYLISRQNIVVAAFMAIGVALLLGYSISSALLWPIESIRQALGRLAAGGFDARVSVPNRDELGELAGHVNRTSEKLGILYGEVEAQKTKLANLNAALEDKVQFQIEEIERTNRLRRFLPAQVAEMIVSAPDEQDVLRTQRAEITVLFADLRGFTAFANAATPNQVVAALNTFHGTCGPLVEACGGTLERFLGDGLMVLLGAPVPMADAAQRAVELAIEMRAKVGASMAEFQAGTEGRSLGVGIGVATGAATLGQIGFEGRMDYSAIGPAPNLAARLCDVAGKDQILISHATAWQVDNAMEPAGPFDLKGIGKNVAAFELVTHAESV